MWIEHRPTVAYRTVSGWCPKKAKLLCRVQPLGVPGKGALHGWICWGPKTQDTHRHTQSERYLACCLLLLVLFMLFLLPCAVKKHEQPLSGWPVHNRGLLCSGGICSCGAQGTSNFQLLILSSVAMSGRPIPSLKKALSSRTRTWSLTSSRGLKTPLASPNSNNGNC